MAYFKRISIKLQTTVLCTRQSNEPEDSLKQNIVDEIPWNKLANKSVFFKLYFSTMATLMGTEESGHCRVGETSQSECMHCPSKRMAVVEGLLSWRGGCLWKLTVFIYVKNVLCCIYHRQLPSLTQLHTLHLRNTQVKTLWYILILNNIFLSVFVQCKLELYRVWWFDKFFFCPFQRTVTNMPGKLESLVNLTGN